MLFYLLAALGALTALVLGLFLVFVVLAWFSQPVPYSVPGAPVEGPFELYCQGSHRADYQPGSVEVIPWTRGYRAGFVLGRLAARILGRD